jgi:hypothetical protein
MISYRFVLVIFTLNLFSVSQAFSANEIFNSMHQDTPLRTMQSMIDGIKDCKNGDISRCRELRTLCHPKGDNDVWMICGMANASTDEKQEIYSFGASISLGAEIINDSDGLVHFTFGIKVDNRRHEYMHLVLEDGKWFISSF